MRQHATDSQLGRHLLTIRGFQFVMGALGDPYALVLCGLTEDKAALGAQIRARGRLYQSNMACWVTGDAAIARQLMYDDRLSPAHPGTDEQQHVFENVWETWNLCHATPLDGAYLSLDRERYGLLNKVARPVLSDIAIEAWREDVEKVAAAVIDPLPDRFDLVADLALPIAVRSTARVLGLPEPCIDELTTMAVTLGIALDAPLCPPKLPVARQLMRHLEQLGAMIGTIVDQRNAEPSDGAISMLLAADDVERTDIVAIGVLAILAGVETAMTSLVNTLGAATDDRDIWSLLCRTPARAIDAVDEATRLSPPVRLKSFIAREDISVAEQTIDRGSQVVVVVDAANRDPAANPDPDRFDIDRPRRDRYLNLALAGATYEPFVTPLARLISQVSVEAVAERLTGLALDGPILRRSRSPVVGSPLSAPCTVS